MSFQSFFMLATTVGFNRQAHQQYDPMDTAVSGNSSRIGVTEGAAGFNRLLDGSKTLKIILCYFLLHVSNC
jgi:hypothetical protein